MMSSCLAVSDSKRRFWSPLFVSAVSALIGVAMTTAASTAHADEATAEALFQAAKTLMEQKKYSEACPKFEASYKIDPAVGTKLNLADCHEKEGKLAQAWGDWGEARDQAKRENDKARMDLAIRRQKELDPKVPKLTVNVTGPVETLEVFRDELKLETAMLGVPLPVDPGAHVVTLRRGKSVLREKKVDVAEKSAGEVTIDATGIPAPPPETKKDPAQQVIVVQQAPKTEMVLRSKGMIAGGVVMGLVGFPVGIVGLVGTIFQETRAIGVVGFLGGAGLLTGGIILIAKGATSVPKPVTGSAIPPPSVFIGPGSISIRGQF